MSRSREREFKFDLGDDVELGDLAAAVPGADVEHLGEQTLEARYFDTADLRLARWGSTLRHRDDEGWVVKVPVERDDDQLVRDEVGFGSTGASPPAAATRLIASLTRGAEVAFVAALTTLRRTTRFLVDGDVIAELVDDRVQVDGPPGACTRFREIELEVAEGAPDETIERLIGLLEEQGCRGGNATPKLVRALGERASAPPDVVVPSVGEQPTGRDVIHAAIAQNVHQLIVELPAARLGEDPEGVHQSRVAIRRLRSDLQTFRPLLDRPWAETLRAELKWLGTLLGDVRDDEVHLGTLEAVDADPVVLEIFRTERKQHRTAMLAALDSPRAMRLLDELVMAAADPRTVPQADDPADDLLQPLVRKRWKKLKRAVDDLGEHPRDDELHRVRILAKRARYAAMATTPAFGRQAKAFAKALGHLQDVIGDLHDAAVITARLHELSGELSPADAFAAGEVAGRLHVDPEAIDRAWRRAWKSASDKRLRRWL